MVKRHHKQHNKVRETPDPNRQADYQTLLSEVTHMVTESLEDSHLLPWEYDEFMDDLKIETLIKTSVREDLQIVEKGRNQ